MTAAILGHVSGVPIEEVLVPLVLLGGLRVVAASVRRSLTWRAGRSARPNRAQVPVYEGSRPSR